MSNQQIDLMMVRAKDSASMLPYWDKTDTIVDGYEAVKLAGQTYLPKFENETIDNYEVRLQLTKFTNIYRDIVESLAAKPFETAITVDNVPNEFKTIIDDIDGAGNSLTIFCALTFFNGLNSALDWIFIDYPSAAETAKIKTISDKTQAGVRAYWSHVLARNVLEARTTVIAGKEELIYIRILEPNSGTNGVDQIRIFEKKDGIVSFSVYEKTEKYDETKKTFFIEKEKGNISIPVIPLVPFITGRRDGRGFKVFPLMQDAADLQIDLYQSESGLKYIKTIAAYPMLAANGMRPEMLPGTSTPKPLQRGPNAVLWGTPDGAGNSGSWSYVEPSSQSMTFLAADIAATKQDLRELGRQPLTAQSGNLTTITTAVAAGKAKSALAALVEKLKDCLMQSFYITSLWEKNKIGEMAINIFDDFDDYNENGKDLETLASARREREISHKTYIQELKNRKVLDQSVTSEDELKELLLEIPSNDGEN